MDVGQWVPTVAVEADDVVWRDPVQSLTNGGGQRLKCARGNAAQVGLQFGEGQLDRIEVRRIGREKAEEATGGFERRADRRVAVHAEIVQDHGRPRNECRHQPLLHPPDKQGAINRSFEDTGSDHAFGTHRHQAGHVGTVIAWNSADHPIPAWSTTTTTGHDGLRAGFIKKDHGRRIERGDLGSPLRADLLIPFRGDQCLFLSGIPSRVKVRLIVAVLTLAYPAAAHRVQCSASVASGVAVT